MAGESDQCRQCKLDLDPTHPRGGAGRGGPTLQGRGGVQDVCTRIRTNTGLHSAVWRPGAAAGDNKLLVYKYVINVIGR